MKYITYLFCLAIIACSETKLPKSERPPNTLSQEKMIEIIKELNYAEAKVNIDKKNKETTKKNIKAYGQEIFNKYGITDSVFFNSMDYYYTVPDSLTKMYDKVIKSMMKDQGEIKKALKKK